MEIGMLVFAYFWWHHSVPFDVFTAIKDDRDGWRLKQWCNAPVVLKKRTVKTIDGKLVKTAIVARQDHPSIEIEVLAELLRTEPIDLAIPLIHPVSVGDVVGLFDGKYEQWYLSQTNDQPYELRGSTKILGDAIRDWRDKHSPDNIGRIPKFTVMAVKDGGMVKVTGKGQIFEIPTSCVFVLEKRHVRPAA